jgi:hypothetical protein
MFIETVIKLFPIMGQSKLVFRNNDMLNTYYFDMIYDVYARPTFERMVLVLASSDIPT